MHHYSSYSGLFTHRLASKQSMWIGDFSGIIYPVTNYHFQLLTCIIMITQYISYYPNHVQSGAQGRSLADEICGFKQLECIYMGNYLIDY